MPLTVKFLCCFASFGLLLQTDCGTILGVTGCLPEFQPLFEQDDTTNGSTSETVVLDGDDVTSKTSTTGVFLVLDNNTEYDIEVYFNADNRTVIAKAFVGQSPRYELAPPDSNSIVTAGTINLNGSWVDAITSQRLVIQNSTLTEWIDENGLRHAFGATDFDPNTDVQSTGGTITRDVTLNTISFSVETQDPNLTTSNSEIRAWKLVPGTAGNTLSGSSVAAQVDLAGQPVEGTQQNFSHLYTRQFPRSLTAVKERDLSPATGALVGESSFSGTTATVTIEDGDYSFGDTITFRVNPTTVSFSVDSPSP